MHAWNIPADPGVQHLSSTRQDASGISVVLNLVYVAAMVEEPPLKIYMYARGVVSYFYFFRAPRARALKIRQTNSAILKVPDAAWIR